MSAPLPARPTLAIVVPALDEEEEIGECLDAFAESIAAREGARDAVEIVVADGGSSDRTREVVRSRGVRAIDAPRGRGPQMNAGARATSAPAILFFHADSRPSRDLVGGLLDRLAASDDPNEAYSFRLVYRSDRPAFRTIERGVAWRCERFGLPYGDQGLCVRRELFERLGGFPERAPEDLEFALRLRRAGRIVMLPHDAATSPRRHERLGLVETTLLNLGSLARGLLLHALRGNRTS